MESETFRSRLLKLLQKSRQAFRLYAAVNKGLGNNGLGNRGPSDNGGPKGDSTELSEMQVSEWRNVNAELIRELSTSLEHPNPKEPISRVFLLRDRIQNEFRAAEAEMHLRQRELISASEKGDFIKAAIVSRQLVVLKARAQANQAVHHEIEDLIGQSHINPPAITLSPEAIIGSAEQKAAGDEKESAAKLARVIPIRKKQMSAF